MQSIDGSTLQNTNREETLFCTPIGFSGFRERKSDSSSDDYEGKSSSSDGAGHFRTPKERSTDNRNARSIMSG